MVTYRPCLSTALAIACAISLQAAIAAAQPSGPAPSQCFLPSNIEGFRAPDEHTVYLRVAVNDIYRLNLTAFCPGLSFRQGIGLQSTPGSPWICSPVDATVVFSDHGVAARCPVTAIHKLTAAELGALPKRDIP